MLRKHFFTGLAAVVGLCCATGGGALCAAEYYFLFQRQSSSLRAQTDSSATTPLVTDSDDSGVQTDTAVATSTAVTSTVVMGDTFTAETSEDATIGTNPSGQNILTLTGLVKTLYIIEDPFYSGTMDVEGSSTATGTVTASVTTNAPAGITTTGVATISVMWATAGDPRNYFASGFCVQVFYKGQPILEAISLDLSTGEVFVQDDNGPRTIYVDPNTDSIALQADLSGVRQNDQFQLVFCPISAVDTPPGLIPGSSMGNFLIDARADVRLNTVQVP